MIRRLIVVLIACFAVKNYAQEGTASPYSYYGIGSLKFKGTVENVAMGGIGIYKDSIHVNLQNPATFGGKNLTLFNKESRPVKFTVAGSHNSTKLNGYKKSDKVQASTFDYLALSVPVNRFGFGFGLMPKTAVGYKLENRAANGNVIDRFNGSGGLNKTFLSFGYEFKNGLSLGVETNYSFGSIANSFIEFRYDDEGELLQLQSLEDNESILGGLGFNFGVHYYKTIERGLELQSSFTFTPESNLTSKNKRFLTAINVGNGPDGIQDTQEIDLTTSGLDKTKVVLPSQFKLGAGVGKPKKWFAGVEYTSQNTQVFRNEFLNNNATFYENASKIAFGGFYIPKFNAAKGYWKRVVYRAGLRSGNTGLNINGKSIKEFGTSFGLGLPVGRMFSNANFTFEYGTRGTSTADLIRENFMNFQISLSLNDRWFIKRKYD